MKQLVILAAALWLIFTAAIAGSVITGSTWKTPLAMLVYPGREDRPFAITWFDLNSGLSVRHTYPDTDTPFINHCQVFMRRTGSQGDTAFSVELNGTDPVPLNVLDDYLPSGHYSPSGQYVFTRTDRFLIWNTQTGSTVFPPVDDLAKQAVFNYFWSPDEGHLVVISRKQDSTENITGYLVQTETGQAAKLDLPGVALGWFWSHNGQLLAALNEKQHIIYILNMQGEIQYQLQAPERVSDIVWLPDDTGLILMIPAPDATQTDAYRWLLADNALEKTTITSGDVRPWWSPDSTLLYIPLNTDPPHHQLIEIPSGRVLMDFPAQRGVKRILWSPDGRYIYVEYYVYEDTDQMLMVDTQLKTTAFLPGVVMQPPGGNAADPAWSDDSSGLFSLEYSTGLLHRVRISSAGVMPDAPLNTGYESASVALRLC